MIRKKMALAVFMAGIMLALAACGKNGAASVSQEATAPEAVHSSEDRAGGLGQAKASQPMEETKGAGDLGETEAGLGEQEKIEAFAERVQEAVADKDMEALADLMSFPVYVKTLDNQGQTMKNRKEFLALDPKKVFGEDLVVAIASIDTASLKQVKAGVVMGDGTPNIIFQAVKGGGFGIKGINQ